jgi:hypothetical protein
LYLADELSPEERAGVEQQLLRDPGMRADLERLGESQNVLEAGLASLDAATPIAAEEAIAVRNVSRLLRQRLARPLVATAAEPARERRRLPRWAVTAALAATVAAVVVAVGVKMNGPQEPGDVLANRDADDPYSDPLLLYALSRYTLDEAPEEGVAEVAAVSYDQPLFDVPFNVPPENSTPQP